MAKTKQDYSDLGALDARSGHSLNMPVKAGSWQHAAYMAGFETMTDELALAKKEVEAYAVRVAAPMTQPAGRTMQKRDRTCKKKVADQRKKSAAIVERIDWMLARAQRNKTRVRPLYAS